MDQQNLAIVLTTLVGVLIGAILGGGSILMIVVRLENNFLNSPLLIQQSQLLAQSWPAPVRQFIHETGTVLETATQDPPVPAPPAPTPTPKTP